MLSLSADGVQDNESDNSKTSYFAANNNQALPQPKKPQTFGGGLKSIWQQNNNIVKKIEARSAPQYENNNND